MDKKEELNIDNLLDELKNRLEHLFDDNLQKCVLFGSYSQQEQTDDSDVDVLVLLTLPHDKIASFNSQLDEITLELSLKYDVVLSLLVKNSDEFYEYSDVLPLYRNIVKEGKLIYG